MLGVILATAVGAALAGAVYLGRERLGAPGLGLAALRTVAFGALFLALFNHENRMRALEGKNAITKIQLRAAFKALL